MVVRADLPGLVAAARGGDTNAFGAVVAQCWDDMVRFARSIVGDAEAEDVVQECLVRAWRGLHRLRDPERFRPWLTTMVYRRCLRWKRWWWRRQPLDDVAPIVTSHDPNPGLDVARLLERLTRRQRAVLHLTVVEGLSDGEIGRLLSMAPGTVRAHRRRARQTLGNVLRGREP